MAAKLNDGGPAFPFQWEERGAFDTSTAVHPGMSVRTYIATQALAGILAYSGAAPSPSAAPSMAATAAVAYADALIAELGL